MKKINVCFICDENYAMPTCVAIQSLCEHINKHFKYNVYVVAVDLSQQSINNFKRLQNRHVKIIVKETNNIYDNIDTQHWYVSKAAMMKFNLPNMLSDLDKVLYVDGDMLILSDLIDLYNIDLGKKYAAVVSDMAAVYAGHNKKIGNDDYFNSGMMLLNLKKCREDGITDKLLYEKKHDSHKHFMDQDAFNKVFADNVIYVSPKWNYMQTNLVFPEQEIIKYFHLSKDFLKNLPNEQRLLHLTNITKPWNSCEAVGYDLWNVYNEHYKFRLKSCLKYIYNTETVRGTQNLYLFGIKVYSFKPKTVTDSIFKGNFLFKKEICSNGRRHIFICGIKVMSYTKHKK